MSAGCATFSSPALLLQYFVSSDVGGGKQQWYGFHKEPENGSDPPGKSRKARLLEIFGHWCSDVTDLIKATPEADILRRDISDRCACVCGWWVRHVLWAHP